MGMASTENMGTFSDMEQDEQDGSVNLTVGWTFIWNTIQKPDSSSTMKNMFLTDNSLNGRMTQETEEYRQPKERSPV